MCDLNTIPPSDTLVDRQHACTLENVSSGGVVKAAVDGKAVIQAHRKGKEHFFESEHDQALSFLEQVTVVQVTEEHLQVHTETRLMLVRIYLMKEDYPSALNHANAVKMDDNPHLEGAVKLAFSVIDTHGHEWCRRLFFHAVEPRLKDMLAYAEENGGLFSWGSWLFKKAGGSTENWAKGQLEVAYKKYPSQGAFFARLYKEAKGYKKHLAYCHQNIEAVRSIYCRTHFVMPLAAPVVKK